MRPGNRLEINGHPERAPEAWAGFCSVAFFIWCTSSCADTIRVPQDHSTIQAAINQASDGDVIEVGNGVYSGAGNRDLDFRGKAITLRSAHGAKKCIINAMGDEGSRRRAFYFHTKESASSVVDGFTIINGFADQHGGAIRIIDSSPTIRNCVIRDHQAMGPGLGNLHGLAAYWDFDDGESGSSSAKDYVQGVSVPLRAPQWTDGMSGQALLMDLNSTCARISANEAYVAADGFTLTAWVKPDYALEWTHNVLKAGGRFTFGIKRGHLFATLFAEDGMTRTVWGATLLEQNAWRHAAVVFDPDQWGVPADLDTLTGLRKEMGVVGLKAGAPNEWDARIREIGNVLYDPSELNPARRYKLFYSGYSGTYAGNNVYVGWAYSPDGLTWTKGGKVHPRPLEDPYVLKNGNMYFLYAEDKADVPFRNIRLLQSFNGTFWSDEGDVFDIAVGGTPFNWESSDVSSPIVWIEDDVWYLMYEGRGGGLSGRIGLATSTNGRDWIRRPDGAPVFFNGVPGEWDDANVVTDDLIKIGDTYYFSYHGFGRTQSSGFWSGLATSTDLMNWTRHPLNPVSPSETLMFLREETGVSIFAVNVDESGITRYKPYVISGPRLFLDGREEKYWQRDDTGDQPAAQSASPMELGCDSTDWRKQYVGALDELRYYTRPLSAEELSRPYEQFAMPMGGAVSCESNSAPALVNCVLHGNQSASAGGAVFADVSSTPRFVNCTVADNVAYAGRGGGVFLQGGGEISNSILWSNAAAVAPHQLSGAASVHFSDVDDNVPSQTNLRAEPRFVDPGRGDYHLQHDSDCINSGGSFPSESSDLDGQQRVMCGQVDIGAYEYGVGDPNCDRRIDTIDFEAFYSCMKMSGNGTPPACKVADFDNDGDVDLADFGQFEVAFEALP